MRAVVRYPLPVSYVPGRGSRWICASGVEGAIAVGTPTERKRSPEARGRQDAEAPRRY